MIGCPIKAVLTHWSGECESNAFLFKIEYSFQTKKSSSTYYTREESRLEKQHNANFSEITAKWHLNEIKMPDIDWASFKDKSTNIFHMLADAINNFLGAKIVDDTDVSGYYGNSRIGLLAEMQKSIVIFDEQFEYKKIARLDTCFDKETESGFILVASRNNI